MVMCGAVSQHLCPGERIGHPLALHRLDYQWFLESQGAYHRGPCLFQAAAVSHAAWTVYTHLPPVQVTVLPTVMFCYFLVHLNSSFEHNHVYKIQR